MTTGAGTTWLTLLSALAITAATASSGAAQEEEVGLPPVGVGAGPFLFDTAEQPGVRVDVIARGLVHGYALAFLPDGDALIVERGARLRRLRGATGANPVLVDRPIAGIPDFSAQAGVLPDDVFGLQDIALDRDFANTRIVYFTYNRPGPRDAAAGRLTGATILAKARLDGDRLVDQKVLITGENVIGTGGSRILVAPDGHLYVTIGAVSIGDIQSAQRLDTIYGKILRIRPDGSIPQDNPFVRTAGARREIYTYGHRDPLGIALTARGDIVASEHGPLGGDELNLILAGRNYGWPLYTFGMQYGGSPLPTSPVGPNTQGPLTTWLPAIAPSGIAVVSGDRFPQWSGNIIIASARRGEVNGTGGLVRLKLDARLHEIRQENLLTELHQRFKDVRQGPDGYLYALTDEDRSVVVRVSPSGR